MFDLETAVAKWRQELLDEGVRSLVLLDELETHVREEVDHLVRSGMEAAQAFELAVRHLGGAADLKKEFMKTGENRWTLWLRRLRRLVSGHHEVPLPPLDDLEPAARLTLALAPEEARHFNHTFIGTEHLLLGLMRSGSAPVARVMQELGITTDAVRQEIERVVTSGPVANTAASIPFTPRARQALRLAAEEASVFKQPQVHAEHVFLGLVREGGGVAALVLQNLGVQLDSARAAIVNELRARPGLG